MMTKDKKREIKILDTYNQRILKGQIIGTITRNVGVNGFRNGFKIIEYDEGNSNHDEMCTRRV